MNIVVVGLGSMGRRRVRLLKMISKDFNIIGVDSREERRRRAEEELAIATKDNLNDTLEEVHPECAIISTSPLAHADIIEICLQANCHVFTELNLVADKYDSNMNLAKKNNRILFLSSTFLYRKEIQYINSVVKDSKENINYMYHVGQYLPDWHPWENISDYFVSDKATNGCRELLAIELPWISKVFGEIESYKVVSGKNTMLPVNYNDNYFLLLEHKGGNKGMIAVDVISRKAVRNLEVYSENLYFTWDGTPDGLYMYDIINKKENVVQLYDSVDKQEGYASFVIEDAYRNELETFLSIVEGKGVAEYTFEDDYKILNLIDEIEGDD